LQQSSNDRPLNLQFSVVGKTGNQFETVHRCQ
jgi:hypothetical protein